MSKKEKSSLTRDKILETALKLFSRKGYLGATTKEIAKDAGIAEVTLFRHFPSKERLFGEVLNTYSFLPILRGLLPEISHMSSQKALTVIAKKFLDTLDSRKEMIQIMNSEMRRYPEKIYKIYHSFIDEMIKTLASYFHAMHKKGIMRKFDTESGARAFLGMFFSYFNAREFHMFKKYRDIDTDETIREFVDIFLRGTLK
ncbi:MAG TPA: TetR/AcrR family transcriptional regulator [Thermodesulfovibrionales bacterium]|nr:TetR/AcrR family transcriptional regulator [Thermodesulfovibrionales bacterium]